MTLAADHARVIESEVAVFRGLYEKLVNGWRLHGDADHRSFRRRDVKNTLAELLVVYPEGEIAGRLAHIISNEQRFTAAIAKLEHVSRALALTLPGGTQKHPEHIVLAVAGTTATEAKSRSSSVTHNFTIAKSGNEIGPTGCYAATLATAREKWFQLETSQTGAAEALVVASRSAVVAVI